MRNTLQIILKLHSAYRMNSFIYGLQQNWLLKKIIPYRFYQFQVFKTILNVFSILFTSIKNLSGHFLFIFIFIFAASAMYQAPNRAEIFIHIFMLLSVGAAYFNPLLFDVSREKYYAIVLMRMDAGLYATVDYYFELFKMAMGYTLFGLLFGMLAGVPFYICISMPLFVVLTRFQSAVFYLYYYEKTGRIPSGKIPSKGVYVMIALALLCAYGLPIIGVVIPTVFFFILLCCLLCASFWLIRRIQTFAYYRECYKVILQPEVLIDPSLVTLVQNQQRDNLVHTEGRSTKRGAGYLNDLFIQRHRRILWKSAQRTALVIAVITLCLGVALAFFPPLKHDVQIIVISKISALLLCMYFINSGQSFTQALFINSDHSLLTYAFFKQPGFIRELFLCRLASIVQINLVPACVLSIGIVSILFVAGSSLLMIEYFAIVVLILSLSIFFSIHYLVIYYLLQPYNAGTEVKSISYNIIIGATYAFNFALLNARFSLIPFAVAVFALCIGYSILASIFVYMIGPKTFRIRP